MMCRVYRCAECKGWFESFSYYLTDAPKNKYGQVYETYRNLIPEPPRFDSEVCREKYEANRPDAMGRSGTPAPGHAVRAAQPPYPRRPPMKGTSR
jgi:hypothetical protein